MHSDWERIKSCGLSVRRKYWVVRMRKKKTDYIKLIMVESS